MKRSKICCARVSRDLKKYHVVENDMFICLPGDMLQIHSADNVQAYAVLLSSDYLNEMHIDLNVHIAIIAPEIVPSNLKKRHLLQT